MNASTGAFKFSPYTGTGADTTHIEFPSIPKIAIQNGEVEFESFQYLYTNRPGDLDPTQGDQLLTQRALDFTRMVNNAPLYRVGYTILARKRLNGNEYADNVYYISGTTYTPPTPAWSDASMPKYPRELLSIDDEPVLIGHADPTTFSHQYSWNNPETAYSNFVWLNDTVRQNYSYNSSRYGYHQTGSYSRCIDIYYLRGIDSSDYAFNLYWPYSVGRSDGTHMTLVSKNYTYGADEIWDPLVGQPIGYRVDVSNPLSSLDKKHIIKKSD